MKTRFFLPFLIACFAFSFTSCKKCYQCEVKDAAGEIEYFLKEICGSKKDFNAYKKVCENQIASDQTCDCAEE